MFFNTSLTELHCLTMRIIEFGRLQVKDMLQHLWTGPILNASVEFVQGGILVEVRANGVTKSVGVSGLLDQIIHEKDMTSPIDYVVCVGHSLPNVCAQFLHQLTFHVDKYVRLLDISEFNIDSIRRNVIVGFWFLH